MEAHLDAKRNTGSDGQEVRHLTLAVVARACKDARSIDPFHQVDRDDARAWLQSGEAAEMLELAGKRIKQADIDAWLNTIPIRGEKPKEKKKCQTKPQNLKNCSPA